MLISRKKFFDAFRAAHHQIRKAPLEASQVAGLEFLLGKFEGDNWKDLRLISYVLATTAHESAWEFQPIKERRSRVGTKGRANQDRYWLTGFYGRGYVQITWRKNYEKLGKAIGVNLTENPELALEKETAYQILVVGMLRGLFTGKKLSDFINKNECDYVGARRIVNGTDKAALIASYAQTFERILRASILSNSLPNEVATSNDPLVLPLNEFREPEILPKESQETSTNEEKPPPEKEWTEGVRPLAPPVEEAETVLPVIQAVADETKPEGNDVLKKAEGWYGWINGKILALPPALGAAGLGFYNWITSASIYLTIGFFGASAAIGITYLCWFMYLKNQRERRGADKEAAENALKMQREQQAHELTMLAAHSTMRRDLNSITISPRPLQNSDSDLVNQENNAVNFRG